MSSIGKKIFFFSISMLCSFSCAAQFVEDIPLFEETPTSISDEKKTMPASLASKPNDKAENVAASTPGDGENSNPNIGRKGIPLDRLFLTPKPFQISIDLRDKVPVEPETQPVNLPVNTREEGIYLPPGGSAEQPSPFVEVHDVREFDLSGFSLGMSAEEVLQMAKQKGFAPVKYKKSLPLFQTTYYEALCREQGIHMPDRVRACIREYGQKNQQDYIEVLTLAKKATREFLHFKFTSPATDNGAWEIIYQNKGDNSLNFTYKNLSKKLNRKEAFFNAVFAKYGYPDDNKQLLWGTPQDAYMQVSMTGTAYDATIKLTDVRLSNEDYFAAQDWKSQHENTFHFGFDE